MNAIISEKRQPVAENKLLLSQVSKEKPEETQDEEDDKMKDKKRIDGFIAKHKKLLVKLAK